MTELKLKSIHCDELTCKEALGDFAGMIFQKETEIVRALVYGPRDCMFALMDKDGELTYSPGHPWPDGEPIFELRAFSTSAELRWLQEKEGRGRASILAEDGAIGLQVKDGWKSCDDMTVSILEPKSTENKEQPRWPDQQVRYILWGTGTGDDIGAGWSRLAEPRIGTLDVPVEGVPSGRHAYLLSRQYIGRGECSNAVIVEERLTGMEAGHE